MKEERQAAVEAILSSGNIPAGMELFAAGDESQMKVIKRWIDESDVYLLILGGRYGSVEEKTGKSYTHLEYEYALELNKPLFSIVISEDALDGKVTKKGRSVLEQENPQKLRTFKDLVLKNLVKFYDDTKDIKIAIHETLSDFAYRKELVGWIRGDNSVNTAQVAEEIARLTRENSELRNQLSKNDNFLYSSLTYGELKGMLEKSKYSKEDGTESNMFEFIVQNGEQFVQDTTFRTKQREFFDALVKFKLMKQSGFSSYLNSEILSYYVRFTEDGHNFYLKALAAADL